MIGLARGSKGCAACRISIRDIPQRSMSCRSQTAARLRSCSTGCAKRFRMRHYSWRTESTYVHWIRRFIVFHHKKHPNTMGAAEVTAFLSWLATSQHVSASTQNQALSALLFLYRHVLQVDIGPIEPAVRGKVPHRIPVVLSPAEVSQVLSQLKGVLWLVVAHLYGAGLRLQECLELRVKDLDFDRHEILVRRGKGQKDRRTMLPAGIEERLRAHLQAVKRRHEQDLADGCGRVGAALCPGSQVSERRLGLGMAVCVSGRADLSRSAVGPAVPISLARVGRAAGGGGCGTQGGRDQTSWVSHHAALICDRIASLWSRHSHGPGTAGSCRRDDHYGVHARAEPRRPRRPQPVRPLVTRLAPD